MPPVVPVLLALNIVAYVVLWLLTLLRLIRHTGRFFGDMFDHLRGAGFFTAVAGTFRPGVFGRGTEGAFGLCGRQF